MQRSQFSLLLKRRFLPLFLTQFLGAFNDNVFRNALVILITYQLVTGPESKMIVTLSTGLFILPFFLFSATAGQMADKFEKSHLVRIFKLSEIVVMSFAAVGFFVHHLSFLLVVLFFMGTQSSLFGPIKYSILPDHLHKDELIGGNALIEAATLIAILLGTILGGVLIILDRNIIAVSIVVLTIAFIGLWTSFYIPKTIPAEPDLKIRWNIFAVIVSIINTTRKNHEVFVAIIGISWFWFIGAIFLTQIPNFTKYTLGAQAPVVTVVLTLFSLGIALGSLMCNRLLKGKISSKFSPFGAFGMSLFIVDLYFSSRNIKVDIHHLISLKQFVSLAQHWHIMFDLLMISICSGIYVVPLYAIMQSYAKKHFRARTIASNNIINSFFMVLSAAMTMGLLTLNFSIIQILLCVGLLNLFMVGYIYFHRVA